MIPIQFMNSSVGAFSELVDQPFDLKSPFRSTALHLAYWRDTEQALKSFRAALTIPVPVDACLAFEHRVPPSEGIGNDSHTDLLIRSAETVIGVEAKYTESKYDLVSKWLGEPIPPNKALVLKGWLDMIASATGSTLNVEAVGNCTYQLLHRTASVCSQKAGQRVVVYHCFDCDDAKREYYLGILRGLTHTIGSCNVLRFCLITHRFHPTDRYRALQDMWQSGVRDLSGDVRTLLKAGEVGTFDAPLVEHV